MEPNENLQAAKDAVRERLKDRRLTEVADELENSDRALEYACSKYSHGEQQRAHIGRLALESYELRREFNAIIDRLNKKADRG